MAPWITRGNMDVPDAFTPTIISAKTPGSRFRNGHWYAGRTRARPEKQVDRLQVRAGFVTYLSLVERERQWEDRKEKVEFPLFAGYTFVRFALRRSLDVVGTPGVRDTGQVPELVDWREPGTSVLVAEGPFRNLKNVTSNLAVSDAP